MSKYYEFVQLLDVIKNNSLSDTNKLSMTSISVSKDNLFLLMQFLHDNKLDNYNYDKYNGVLFVNIMNNYFVIKIINQDNNTFNLSNEEKDYLLNLKVDYKVYSYTSSQIFNYAKIVSSNQSIYMRKHTRFVNFPRHRHDYIELIYVRRGKLVHTTDKETIVMQSGDIFLMNQEVYHSILKSSYEDEIYNFLIDPEYFRALILLFREHSRLANFFIKALTNYSNNVAEYVYFKYNDNIENNFLFEKLITLFEDYENNIGKIQIIFGYIFLNIIEDHNSYKIVTFNNYEQDIKLIVQNYITTNYQNANLEELANNLNMRDYQLSKLIKLTYGKTFKNLLVKEKMDNAVKLLNNTNLSIESIVEYIGYKSVSHFYSKFKEIYGITPIEYKGNNNKKTQ